MTENFAHQAHLFDPNMARPTVIIGAGSIGSLVTLALAKMGVSDILVIDHDTVDSHNGPMSLYHSGDVGRRKVDVLMARVRDLTGVEIQTKCEEFTDQLLPKATIIACVDSMKARSAIWNGIKGKFKYDLFIDTRTAATYAEVFAISPRLQADQEHYESFLHDDKEGAIQNCGEHGVIFVSMNVASTVSATVARFWQTGQKKHCHAMRCDILETVQL